MEIRCNDRLTLLRQMHPFWLAVTMWFHELKALDFPRLKSIQKYNKKTAEDTISKLMRLDGFTEDEIVKTLNLSFYDTFWSKNLYSVCACRDKTKNGLSKFENIYNKLPQESEQNEAPYEQLG